MGENYQKSLIAAVASNGVIGRDNAMPWHLKGDLTFFKKITVNKAVIMGRKTFDSIGKPLSDRINIVVTANVDWQHTGVLTASSVACAMEVAKKAIETHKESIVREIIVIGGANIYAQTIHMADALYITEIKGEIQGDAFFPPIESRLWKEVSRSEDRIEQGLSYCFVHYNRR